MTQDTAANGGESTKNLRRMMRTAHSVPQGSSNGPFITRSQRGVIAIKEKMKLIHCLKFSNRALPRLYCVNDCEIISAA